MSVQLSRVAMLLPAYLLLCSAVLAQTATPSDAGRSLRFEVVSVKENTGADRTIHFEAPAPDMYRQANVALVYSVTYAFNIPQPSRLVGMPAWTRTTRYDIVGKAARPISEDERRAMVRDVLESRFHLRAHSESRNQTVYVMSLAHPNGGLGPGLKPRPECEAQKCDSGGTGRPDGIDMRAMTLTQLADGMLSNILRQVVRDETGVTGRFDVHASWRPDTATADRNDPRPSLFTALEEQLGLKLEPQRRPVDVLVVDSITRPDPD